MILKLRYSVFTRFGRPLIMNKFYFSGAEEDQQNPINKKFLFFVVFISCCGLSLILLGEKIIKSNFESVDSFWLLKILPTLLNSIVLAAFLWRKYTRTPNCDTSVFEQNQHQVLTK